MPPLKKAKTTNKTHIDSGARSDQTETPAGGSSQPAQHASTKPDAKTGSPGRDADTAVAHDEEVQKKLNARQSWYGGTWPRTPAKAAPVTQLAKESIPGSGDGASRAAPSSKAKAASVRSVSRAPSVYMSPGFPTRSLPSTGTPSKVSVSTPKLGHTESHDGTEEETLDGKSRKVTEMTESDHKDGNPAEIANDLSKPDSGPGGPKDHAAIDDGTAWGMSSWIPGFNRGQQAPNKLLPDTVKPIASEHAQKTTPAASDTAALGILPVQASEAREAEHDAERSQDTDTADGPADKPEGSTAARPRSWFGLWNGEAAAKSTPTSQAQDEDTKPDIDTDLAIRAASPQKAQAADAGDEGQTPEERAAATSAAIADMQEPESGPTGSIRSGRWSWWSKAPAEQGTGENHPQAASSGLKTKSTSDVPSTQDTTMTGTESPSSTSTARKRERPASSDMLDAGREDKISKQSADGKTKATAAVNVVRDEGSGKGKEKPIQREHDSSNLLLPSLKQTYRAAASPGLIERLTQYFFSHKMQVTKHASLAKEPPKIKRAIAIGVHGYFPTPFIRTVIGQPRGTSVRFATKAEEAIRDWCQKHGCGSAKVDKVVLEGEGKIEERVDLLWKLLIKQVELIREADFILVACHSQGVPVAVQLVAKLIDFGVLANTKVGICAMAGVNLGPFVEYKSRWIGGSAGELFDFATPDSKVSVDYENALSTVLKSGIKVVFVGSIDDQLVSMESATFGCADHPGLFRAVFINGQVHAPTFVVHLVGFALKLRNLGVPDHGLIRELSNSLAGSFTGDGHSRLYEDGALYDLATEFALETTPVTDVALNVRRSAAAGSPQNPYILPFAMRGVLEEQFVKSDLHDEMNELLAQFDDWRPSTKQLKEVKYRLEGVRSKI